MSGPANEQNYENKKENKWKMTDEEPKKSWKYEEKLDCWAIIQCVNSKWYLCDDQWPISYAYL